MATRRTTRLKSELDEQAAVAAARRDYEFEARKRLYAECEPLFFQALELAEDARWRILSLARTARRGYLRRDGSGWLEDDGYFYKSTAFMLLAPITSYKILQRQLTAIDLGLEQRLRKQYELLKLIFLSFTRDFELARCKSELSYNPDAADPGEQDRDELLRYQPETYARQGFYRGVIEMISEALITPTDSAVADVPRSGSRCKSLGEFWIELDDPGSPLGRHADEIGALFFGFHPQRKPVLWRVLVAQHRVYGAFLQSLHSEDGNPSLPPLSGSDFTDLNWRDDGVARGSVRNTIVTADVYAREAIDEALRVPEKTPTTR